MHRPDGSEQTIKLRALLENYRHGHDFPPELEKDFRAYMVDQGLRFNQDGTMAILVAVPALYIIFYILTRLLSAPPFLDENLRILNWTMLAEFAFTIHIVMMRWLPAIRKLFSLYTVIAWSGLVAVAIIGATSMPDPYLRTLAQFPVAMLIMTIFALGVFDKRLSMLSALVGSFIAIISIQTLELSFNAGIFITSTSLPIGLGILIASLTEMRDRIGFLQEKLLESERNLLEEYSLMVEKLSRSDALTGLANRRHFNEMLEREWSASKRNGEPLALAFIDVDYFKPYNDTYGHQQGDLVLARIGSALKQCAMRPDDLAARYGGEEFVMLLPSTDEEGALKVARHISQTVSSLAIPHIASRVSDQVTLSIGIAIRTRDTGFEAHELIAAADAAVYDAKHQGRNRIVIAGYDNDKIAKRSEL
jgi:diguanylate cyclase (GGDEF)-like protein